MNIPIFVLHDKRMARECKNCGHRYGIHSGYTGMCPDKNGVLPDSETILNGKITFFEEKGEQNGN